MNDDELLAETLAFNAALEELLKTLPQLPDLPIVETRRLQREGGGALPGPVFLEEAEEVAIPGRARDIPVRVLRPSESRGAYLHFHGGGWSIGAHDMQDVQLRELAVTTGLTVYSVGYRLGPEDPYPAGPDDCEDAALWLLEHERGVLTLGGESAGAHLSVVTLLRLRDRHGIDPRRFAAANLVFGAFDLTGTPSRLLWGDRDLVLSGPLMDWFAENFLAGLTPDERRAPDISPLYADLRGMPPALFTCGTADPLLDDTLFMETRWRAAGNEARLTIWPDAPHAFVAFPIEVARRSLAEQHAFLSGASPART